MRLSRTAYTSTLTLLLTVTLTWTASWAATKPAAKADLGLAAQSKDVTDAIEKFEQRDYDAALKLLKSAAKKNADLPPAQVIMAQLFSQTGVGLGVRNALEQAISDSPNDPEAYQLIAEIALRDHRYAESELMYKKADELMANFTNSAKRKSEIQVKIIDGLAAVNETREKWAIAQKYLEALLKLDAKNAPALHRLARCLFQQKQSEAAYDKLKEAVKADPKVLTPEAVLGQFYEQAGDRDNAKKWMTAALRAAPKDLNTHLVVGQWALEAEQMPEAEKEAKAALHIDPKSLEAKILCGVIALFKKDYAEAERFFDSAHTQNARHFPASNNLALVLIEQKDEGKRRRALEYATNNVQTYPRLPEAASTYGWVLYKLGRLDEAENAFQKATSGGSVVPDTAYYIAKLLYDRGRESQAKQWLELALKSNGPFAMRQEAKELLDMIKK
jgi:tetratricopeptide (TPR) repeat protein